jgi:diguanylate cyclase (GGDEF)-like protein
VSVVLCDINGLKHINDTFGHTAGDELLRLVARQLSAEAGETAGSMAARIGGDEFVLLLDGATEPQVEAAVTRLADTELPHGASIAVGAATTASRPAGADSITGATRALMRLADAAQYRHKQTRQLSAGRLPSTATAVAVLYPHGEDDLAERVLDQLKRGTDRSVEWRLQVVGDVLSEAFDVWSWWVSRQDGATIVDVLGRMVRPDSRGELAQTELMSGTEFHPDDFPATARALAGGSFYASLTEGDENERAFLARGGYVCMLAAGDRADDGTRWLLEMLGDPQTSAGLFVARPLLRALVYVAVCGAGRP